MKILNYTFTSSTSLLSFISENNIPNSRKTFIQVFFSKLKEEETLKEVLSLLNTKLSKTTIIGTSTAGNIMDGAIHETKITISFSLFKKTITKNLTFVNNDSLSIVNSLKKDLITSSSKALIIFANPFKVNISSLLLEISKKFPKLIVSGGYSADDYIFEKGFVFSNNFESVDIVITSLDSNSLIINTNYLLNYTTIGKSMKVTKSKENTIYELDNMPILEVYKKTFLKDSSTFIDTSGMEFPLIFQDNNCSVARAAIHINEDLSVVFSGNIKNGTEVKFSFFDEDNLNKNKFSIESENFDGIYVYSCAGRKKYLGRNIEEEFKQLDKLSTTSGFITYGEFYHDQKLCNNYLFNATTTYITILEPTIIMKYFLFLKDLSFHLLNRIIHKKETENE